MSTTRSATLGGNTESGGSVFSWLAWVGREALTLVSYLGALAALVPRAGLGLLEFPQGVRGWLRSVNRELVWQLGMGLPLVALVHVGIGSFLAMQAYFGGTFVDGTGAVVGVGLIRNVAPQMACLTLAGILAAQLVPQFRRASRELHQSTPPDRRDVGRRELDRRIGFVLLASCVAGVVLSIWGAVVGTIVGWRVGVSMMGVTTHDFFLMFWEMLWWRDVVGLALKGVGFGLASGIFAVHEGLGDPLGQTPDSIPTAACRAACLAAFTILVINSSWFLLAYHAGPMFGPTLLTPPTT
ncbi:MAG: ABC transporter permease [Isosphaeraceae bacterium]